MKETPKVLKKPAWCPNRGGNFAIVVLAVLLAVLLLYSPVAWNYTAAYRSKLWLHRCNSLEKLQEQSERFRNVELDLVFRETTGRFDVTHDLDTTFHLGLRPYIQHAARRHCRLWLDVKNLTPANAAAALARLDSLCAECGLKPDSLIVESRRPELLVPFTRRGYFTSYYVPFDKPSRLAHPESALAHIRRVAQSGQVRAVSFPSWWYTSLRGQLPPEIAMLTWLHRSTEPEVRLWPGHFYLLADPQVKVVLIKSKGKYHR